MTGMDELPIGVIGEIVAGVDVGRFVEIVDDAENTGGFLVVTYADADRSPEVFDSWLESIGLFGSERGVGPGRGTGALRI